MPQNLGVILRKTTGFGGLGPCPLDRECKSREFLKNLARGSPLGDTAPTGSHWPRFDIYIHTLRCIYILYKVMTSYSSIVTWQTKNTILQTSNSKLQFQNFKFKTSKNISKKKLQKNSKCHISNFSSPETKSRILKCQKSVSNSLTNSLTN